MEQKIEYEVFLRNSNTTLILESSNDYDIAFEYAKKAAKSIPLNDETDIIICKKTWECISNIPNIVTAGIKNGYM